MDTDRLVEVAPHYIVMLVLVYLALAISAQKPGSPTAAPTMAIIAVVVVAYRPVVMRLGIGPSAWERQ